MCIETGGGMMICFPVELSQSVSSTALERREYNEYKRKETQ